MTIGENIKKYRKINNITQKDLAEKLNVTIRTIQNYESNNREPKIDTLKSIANILNISLNELLYDKNIEEDIVINTNKKYYEKLSNQELINLIDCGDINKKKLEEILKKEKDIFLKDLSRVMPTEYIVQHYINKINTLTKDDLINLSNEILIYGETLLNTFIDTEYTPKIKDLLSKLNESYLIIEEQDKLIESKNKEIDNWKFKINDLVNIILNNLKKFKD